MTTAANKETGEIVGNPDFERADEALLEEWWGIKDYLSRFTPRIRQIEAEILRRMQERKARALASKWAEVTLSTGTDVNRNLLSPILTLEGIPTDKLSEAYKPKRMVEAPEEWNLTKAKALTKYNGAVADILKAATYETAPTLRMKFTPSITADSLPF